MEWGLKGLAKALEILNRTDEVTVDDQELRTLIVDILAGMKVSFEVIGNLIHIFE